MLIKMIKDIQEKKRVKPILITLKLKLILIPSPRVGRNQNDQILADTERPVEVREIKANQYILHRR